MLGLTTPPLLCAHSKLQVEQTCADLTSGFEIDQLDCYRQVQSNWRGLGDPSGQYIRLLLCVTKLKSYVFVVVQNTWKIIYLLQHRNDNPPVCGYIFICIIKVLLRPNAPAVA